MIVNEGRQFVGSLVVCDDVITEIYEGEDAATECCKDGMCPENCEVIDASGCYVMPGVIDTHVHFREPGLTHKADIDSESRAAAYGGVTSYFDMPNTVPQTTTLEALNEKFAIAQKKSHVNYSFFPGATNTNADELAELDYTRYPGIKLFMGSSTGNMLVDKYGSLLKLFKMAAEKGIVIMSHCEDTDIINQNMANVKKQVGDDPDVSFHPLIRSTDACMESSCLAANLARQCGTRLHIAHVTTEEELNTIAPQSDFSGIGEATGVNVTFEATVAHLMFCNSDYSTLRSLIKCNPAIKKQSDRDALRRGLADGRITTIGTDHAPHALEEKQGGAAKAMSGMPMIQFSLVTMMSLVEEGVLSMERMVELMCHNPARLFHINQRGFLRKGYKADLVIVRPGTSWTVTEDLIQSKCRWSPMTGRTYNNRVAATMCNGHFVLRDGVFDEAYIGEPLSFAN